MATETQNQPDSASTAAAAAAVAGPSLLDEVVSAYKQTPRDEAEDLLRTLTEIGRASCRERVLVAV